MRERPDPHDVEVDLWGRIMTDYHRGLPAPYAYRYADGRLDEDHSPEVYFAPPDQSFEWEGELLPHVQDPVLDLGCGPGRWSLWAQEQGHRVVALDASAGVCKLARDRGVRDVRQGRWQDLPDLLAPGELRFGTVLLMGHNVGLAETLWGLTDLLDRCRAVTRPGATLLATSVVFRELPEFCLPASLGEPPARDATPATGHLPARRTPPAAERPPASGTPSPARREAGHGESESLLPPDWLRGTLHDGPYLGEQCLRVEYQGRVGPYFRWLLVDPHDLFRAAAESGWRGVRIVRDESAHYGAVLQRR